MNKQKLIEDKAIEIQNTLCDGDVVFVKQKMKLDDGDIETSTTHTFDDVLICATDHFQMDDELRKFFNDEENRLRLSMSDALNKVSNQLAEQIIDIELKEECL